MSSLSSSIDWFVICVTFAAAGFFKFFFSFFVVSFLFSVLRCFLFLFEVSVSSSSDVSSFSSFSPSANSSSYKKKNDKISKSRNPSNIVFRFFFLQRTKTSLKRTRQCRTVFIGSGSLPVALSKLTAFHRKGKRHWLFKNPFGFSSEVGWGRQLVPCATPCTSIPVLHLDKYGLLNEKEVDIQPSWPNKLGH